MLRINRFRTCWLLVLLLSIPACSYPAVAVSTATGLEGKTRVAILPFTTPKNKPDLEQYGEWHFALIE